MRARKAWFARPFVRHDGRVFIEVASGKDMPVRVPFQRVYDAECPYREAVAIVSASDNLLELENASPRNRSSRIFVECEEE